MYCLQGLLSKQTQQVSLSEIHCICLMSRDIVCIGMAIHKLIDFCSACHATVMWHNNSIKIQLFAFHWLPISCFTVCTFGWKLIIKMHLNINKKCTFCPWGHFVRGLFVRGHFVMGTFCPGTFCPRTFCPGTTGVLAPNL